MIPTEYDLQVAEDHCRELRRQASLDRALRAAGPAASSHPSIYDRLRSLTARLHLTRSTAPQAKAAV